MDKWATLEPVKLHESSKPSTKSRLLTNRFSTKPLASRSAFVGPLPAEIHILILAFLPIPSLPSYARASRALYRLSQDERLWERKWNALGVAKHDLSSILDDLEGKNLLGSTSKGPPMLTVDDEDDFGDFASAPLAVRLSTPLPTEAGNFVNFSGLTNMTLNSAPTKPSFRSLYIRAHTALIPLCRALLSPPHLVLSSLFPPPSPPRLRRQSLILHLLALFLSPSIQPLKTWSSLRYALRAAMDRFDAALLSAFDTADGKGDEPGMKEAAWGSWEVWEGKEGEEWEMGKVWAEKREIFYEGSDWNPLNNFTWVVSLKYSRYQLKLCLVYSKEGKLGFEPMDEFINHILDAIRTDGSRAVRVFPPTSGVLPAFSERLAVEVVGVINWDRLLRAEWTASTHR
jgi:recyclin-1